MEISSKKEWLDEVTDRRTFPYISLAGLIIIILNLISCSPQFGQMVISKPDEFRHNYEANESIILKSIARVFREKSVGSNVNINYKNITVDSDYFIQGDWRTRSNARVRRLNWKECEVVLSVITEKKTETGWEMRRLLNKDQYEVFFSTIELKIYEEMSKIE